MLHFHQCQSRVIVVKAIGALLDWFIGWIGSNLGHNEHQDNLVWIDSVQPALERLEKVGVAEAVKGAFAQIGRQTAKITRVVFLLKWVYHETPILLS